MHIHFVCSGNAYRSRLAEAYFKSKLGGKKITANSSGITAAEHKYGNGPICWYAMRLMKRNGLIPFMSWHEKQTTKESLKDVDLLVCMKKMHLDYCRDTLGYAGPAEIWDISDLNELDDFIPGTVPGRETDINHIELTEKTFETIKKQVDDLLYKTGESAG